MAKAEPDRWLVVDATQSVPDTQATICKRLERLLAERLWQFDTKTSEGSGDHLGC
jgi:hypothetical protein